MEMARDHEPGLCVWHDCNGKGLLVSEADWLQAIGVAGRFPANGGQPRFRNPWTSADGYSAAL
jgi:hypothetical protein